LVWARFGLHQSLLFAVPLTPYLSKMTLPTPETIAPTLALIEMLAREAISTLPPAFRDAATLVHLRVEDFASDELLEAMDLTDAFELTGLYEGVPLTEKSSMDQPLGPDVIWLFRRPILDEWAERGNVSLQELVSHVLIHELAHHFGWSDEDIAAIDPWWE
jgi:predicted Zn-dependent protease with MMP-like domain